MNLFRKKQKSTISNCTFYAPTDGTLIQIDDLNDGMFSEKMMGEGFAILPEIDEIYSPIEGKIISIFPTKHAIGIQNNQGIEVLVHMGIDTVDLKGEPFQLYVKVGDSINNKTKLADMNIAMVKNNGKRAEIIVVITNSVQIQQFILNRIDKVRHHDEVASCKSVR